MRKQHIFTAMLAALVLAFFPGSKATAYAGENTTEVITTGENDSAAELIQTATSDETSTDKQTEEKKSEKEKSTSKSKTADDYAMSEVAGLAVIAVVTFGYFYIQNRKRRR